MKNWLVWKDLEAGKDWRQEEKGTIEDGMAKWHHWLNGITDMSLSKLQKIMKNREAWWASVYGLQSQTWLREFGLWELDHKEGRMPKNRCFWMVVLEKTLENPLNSKEIQPVHPKGNQPWIFIGKVYAQAEAPILWLPDAKNWLIGKDPDDGKDWRQEEKGLTEDKMTGWHY